jgi:hypothetical protein
MSLDVKPTSIVKKIAIDLSNSPAIQSEFGINLPVDTDKARGRAILTYDDMNITDLEGYSIRTVLTHVAYHERSTAGPHNQRIKTTADIQVHLHKNKLKGTKMQDTMLELQEKSFVLEREIWRLAGNENFYTGDCHEYWSDLKVSDVDYVSQASELTAVIAVQVTFYRLVGCGEFMPDPV